ncbi:nucleoside triphosphate pyrophosphohydrolase [Candidatus Woesearchaeota archaeon]|nr:nucleoside triphosphate pyrophosphohydrolase [Candidatus Woesearchaeota archaeon]
MKYNKLVRDRIPEIIEKDNEIPVTHIADEAEYWQKLKEKLKEEVDEFIEGGDEKTELADILEVVHAICDFKQIDKDQLESVRKERAEKRGAFKKRIILDETKEK